MKPFLIMVLQTNQRELYMLSVGDTKKNQLLTCYIASLLSFIWNKCIFICKKKYLLLFRSVNFYDLMNRKKCFMTENKLKCIDQLLF